MPGRLGTTFKFNLDQSVPVGHIRRRTVLVALTALTFLVTTPQDAQVANVVVLSHGDNPSLTRPTAQAVLWIGTVRPDAARDGDEWLIS